MLPESDERRRGAYAVHQAQGQGVESLAARLTLFLQGRWDWMETGSNRQTPVKEPHAPYRVLRDTSYPLPGRERAEPAPYPDAGVRVSSGSAQGGAKAGILG